MFIVFIEQNKTHSRMFLETLELLERTSKNEANSFFDVLSSISIEGPIVHSIIGFIFYVISCILIDGPMAHWLVGFIL